MQILQKAEDTMRRICEKTAGSLAADRQTRTLPVILSEVVFAGGWVISLVKAASSEPNPTNWVNVEAQSIAISALYLWATSAIVLGSLIGASQTEDSIPRILESFEQELGEIRIDSRRQACCGPQCKCKPSENDVTEAPAVAVGLNFNQGLQDVDELEETTWSRRSRDRAMNGGTYSWRPTKWDETGIELNTSGITLLGHSLIAILVVGSSFMISAILSFLVSPRGPSCRHIPETIV
jgi:hypothetical protein